MTTARKRVADAAYEIIKANPTGIRWADLHRAVRAALPDENPNTVAGSLHHYRNHPHADVIRPDRGIYAIEGSAQADATPAATLVTIAVKHRESDFYQPFADWLENDLEEVTVAKPIGGNGAGGKWGTPDVIGLYAAKPSDPVKFTTEVLAVEIKIDTQSLIVAFGQACAYKLFAHRVYIAVSRNSNQSDLKRLDALAGVVGIGLVKFNSEDPDNPDFQVMVRAAKHEPDYYYTNEVLSNFKREFGL